ncbi:hypothetical protein [Hymenobacter algoricola]|uniref:Uncharacterized protein n=1 Tax=Hymenobacter algoricola TaxID=486267 RepID=A0ABP7NGC6_9BACT
MTVVKEVADGIKLVAESIKNLKEVYAVVQEGLGYFEKTYPDIKKDVSGMCVELRKTCNAIATASAVMTHFRFNTTPGAIASEPTRFNEYFIKYKDDRTEIESLIRSLKGSCGKIVAHTERLKREAAPRFSNSFLALFGLHSAARAERVQQALGNICNEEQVLSIVVGRLSDSIHKAVSDVSDMLGPHGMMHADNVPQAAQLLNVYAGMFAELEMQAREQVEELQELIDKLNE